MNNIKLLDCTLRDGGYINNWDFGKDVISRLVNQVLIAGVEVMELGYLSTVNSGDEDTARYSSMKDVRRAYSNIKSDHQDYAVMINYGEYLADLLPKAEPDDPIIRVAFHRKNLKDAFELINALDGKGFRYYIQPMGVLNYSDKDFIELINMANATHAEAFYVVDSFGVLELKDFRRLIFLVDNNLRPEITLGYHAHNNLQQAYSNAKYMIEQGLSHNLIIDASVFGMGRGAGNLNIELFAKHLNRYYGKNYNIEPFLEVFDECLKPIFVRQFWGYSLPFYLSSIHNCHPNYALFFSEKNTLTVKSIHELLSRISDEDKIGFSKDKAAQYYNSYMDNYLDDKADVKTLYDSIGERPVLILAPGKSIIREMETVKSYITKCKPVVIGVNRSSEEYKYDYLFVTNEKRLVDKPANVGKFIKTSNLHKILPETLQVNYSSYLAQNTIVCDNPTLMLFNLLVSMGIREVAVAGFDGFSSNPEDNYFAQGLSMGSSITSKVEKNKMVSDEVKGLQKRIKINFLTDSLYK